MATTGYLEGIVHGHSPGAVTIMWDTKLDTCVRPLDIHLDWCAAIEITLGSKKCTILNVYVPYQCHDNEPVYVEKTGYS